MPGLGFEPECHIVGRQQLQTGPASMFPLFYVGKVSVLMKIRKLPILHCAIMTFIINMTTFETQCLLSVRLERMAAVMTRQALFQARTFRKSKIRSVYVHCILQ